MEIWSRNSLRILALVPAICLLQGFTDPWVQQIGDVSQDTNDPDLLKQGSLRLGEFALGTNLQSVRDKYPAASLQNEEDDQDTSGNTFGLQVDHVVEPIILHQQVANAEQLMVTEYFFTPKPDGRLFRVTREIQSTGNICSRALQQVVAQNGDPQIVDGSYSRWSHHGISDSQNLEVRCPDQHTFLAKIEDLQILQRYQVMRSEAQQKKLQEILPGATSGADLARQP